MLKNVQINRAHHFYVGLDFRNAIKINSDYEIELTVKLSHNFFSLFVRWYKRGAVNYREVEEWAVVIKSKKVAFKIIAQSSLGSTIKWLP